MEPENDKPEPAKLQDAVPKDGARLKDAEQNVGETKIGEAKDATPETADAKTAEVEPDIKAEETETARPKIVLPRFDERKFARVTRRELLKVAPVIALGAFVIPGAQEWLLKKGLGFSDWASGVMFRKKHAATTFADSEVTPFEKFPINGYDVDDPGVDFDAWTLTVTGAVQKPGDYKLVQIQTLPRVRQNTRHVCVEGWDVIGRFGGTRLSNFLNMIGADTTARYITVACADDYYESLDMATALHPQTLLCWEMYDRPLTREHGAPLRLNIPTKVGYKQAKYLTDLKVTNVLDKVGYWEDQGYSEFYGM
jgi:DMSO/TMAO reductase YedYZ molybdopterin-dependent catalytic subunit